jgi:hypothetical protein
MLQIFVDEKKRIELNLDSHEQNYSFYRSSCKSIFKNLRSLYFLILY